MIVLTKSESKIMQHPKGPPMELLRNTTLGKEFEIQIRLGYFIKNI